MEKSNVDEVKSEERIKEILESKDIVKFSFDTNVMFAYLKQKDTFHLEAKTAIDGLVLKNVYFVVPYFILGEFIAHRKLLGKNFSVRKAIQEYAKFEAKLKNRIIGGEPLTIETILRFYRNCSRHRKFLDLSFSDFVILSLLGEIKNVRILTCDKKMKRCGESRFKNCIYYLPSHTKGLKSDYPKLMSEIQSDFGARFSKK